MRRGRYAGQGRGGAGAVRALIGELVDDHGNHNGRELASASPRIGYNSIRLVRYLTEKPVTLRASLADMRDPVRRLRAAYDLAADLLTLFGIDQAALLRPEGTLNPKGGAGDVQQMILQSSRHLGSPT